MEVTGDDAVELAYSRRPGNPRSGVGVNVRVAAYSEVGTELVSPFAAAVGRAAKRLGAPLIPVPISSHPADSDVRQLEWMAAELPGLWAGRPHRDGPLQAIEQVGLCRVVVSGSYHAAVFALAQGIPVVCLEKSAYYAQKFYGLQAQFGAGCAAVSMAEPNFGHRLEEAICEAWASADHLRTPLLDAAALQIEKSRAAYARVFGSLN